MWKFKRQFEDLKIKTSENMIVDKFTITDQKVDHLLKLHSDYAEYFERDQNDVPTLVKPKRQRDEG